jgi:neutral amino acid transport system permease protein
VSNTHAVRNFTPRRVVLLLGLLLTALTLSTLGAGAAHADEINTDQYEYVLSGNVQFDGEPLEDVLISVDGAGYEAGVVTDADGKWRIGVPEEETYTVALDEDTLPEGVVVAKGGSEVEAEFGLTKTKSVNFFLGEGERSTVSFFDQFVNRFINGLNFGLLLALAAIGMSLIFGTTGLSNFAHAEMITSGWRSWWPSC